MKMYVDYVRAYKKSDDYNYVQVTFKVDMSNENVNGSGVWLSGGDLGSGQPGGIQMSLSENSNIWQTTLTLLQILLIHISIVMDIFQTLGKEVGKM